MDEIPLPDTIEQALDGYPIPSKSGKKPDVRSGDLFYIDKSIFLPPLPPGIRHQVEELGYTARYYDFPPVNLSSVIETFLSVNVKKNFLSGYSSSVKKKLCLRGNLVYYAVTHMIAHERTVELIGIDVNCQNQLARYKEDEDEIAIIVVYSHDVVEIDKKKSGAVVLIAGDEVTKYDAWIDSINEMYVQNKLPKMMGNGR